MPDRDDIHLSRQTQQRGLKKLAYSQESYSPNERQSVVGKIGNARRFAGSKILPRTGNMINNKCKSNVEDESEPKGFELARRS